MTLPAGIVPVTDKVPQIGIGLHAFTRDSEYGVEWQRAPDDGGGDPDVGSAVSVAKLPPSSRFFMDARESEDATWHYRWRHVRTSYTEGAWTPWLAARARTIPAIIPEAGQNPLLDASIYLDPSSGEVLLEVNADPWLRSVQWEVDATGSWPDLDDGGSTCTALDANGDASISTGTVPTSGQTARAELRFWDGASCSGNAVGTLRLAVPFDDQGLVAVARLELDITVDVSDVSFTARSYLGDVLSGVIEFLDPERTFASAGSITATDKTLTISGGDLTDQDVGKYVSVAAAGPAAALLTSRIDSVTSATVCELEDAAGTTAAGETVILGGGFFQDFDYSGTPGNTETNTRNRAAAGLDTSYITLRAVAGGQTTNPQTILLNPVMTPTVSGVTAQGHDDSTDIDWSSTWTNEGSTNSTDHDLTIQYLVDGVVVEQETGVSVDESQPYLHSTSGAGGLPGGEIGSAIFILELKADNSTLDSKTARGRVLTT